MLATAPIVTTDSAILESGAACASYIPSCLSHFSSTLSLASFLLLLLLFHSLEGFLPVQIYTHSLLWQGTNGFAKAY